MVCVFFLCADDSNAADLWLLNSCTVKNPAEDHFRNEVTKGRKNGKHVVVAGCVPQGAPRADYVQVSNNSLKPVLFTRRNGQGNSIIRVLSKSIIVISSNAPMSLKENLSIHRNFYIAQLSKVSECKL